MFRRLIQKLLGHGNPIGVDLDLNHYEIPEPLYFGSLRAVTRAVHCETGQAIALKHVSPRLSDPEKIRNASEGLKRESLIGSKLVHTNIVRVFGLRNYQDTTYLLMEFLPDGSLLQVIRSRNRYSFRQLLDMAIQVASGLAFLHRNKIVHRDLKPSNILFSGDRAVIADLGLCDAPSIRGVKEAPPRSGTPKYMSPEQTRGWELAPTSDIYSFGIILHEMFTGEMSITAEEAYNRQARTLTYHFPVPREMNPDVPEPLNDLIMKCLHNSRKIRFQDGYQLLQQLKNIKSMNFGNG